MSQDLMDFNVVNSSGPPNIPTLLSVIRLHGQKSQILFRTSSSSVWLDICRLEQIGSKSTTSYKRLFYANKDWLSNVWVLLYRLAFNTLSSCLLFVCFLLLFFLSRMQLDRTMDLDERRLIRSAIRELRRREIEDMEAALASKRFRPTRLKQQEDKENQHR